MCGIVGVFLLNKPDIVVSPVARRLISLFFHNELLLHTMSRGKDSTGISVSFGPPVGAPEKASPSFWSVLKQPVDAYDFMLNDGTQERYRGQDEAANYESLMDAASLLQRPLYHVLGHARKKTKGSEFNPLNNHPILVGNIIGVHNGGIKNESEIYAAYPDMTAQGEVDSEVIVQLLSLLGNDRELRTSDIPSVTEHLDGGYAVMAYNKKFPTRVLYFRNDAKPIELAYIEELGLAIVCSDQSFLHDAFHAYQRVRLSLRRDLPELSVQWRAVRNNSGGVIDVETEVVDDSDINALFPLVNCLAPKAEYKSKNYWQEQNHHGSATYIHGGHHVGTAAPIKQLGPPRIIEAEAIPLEDLPGYAAEETVISTSVSTVNAKVVLDEPSVEDTESAIEATISEIEDDSLLQKRGIEYVFGQEGKDNKSLLINKSKQDIAALILHPGLDTDDAAEIVHIVYPDIFGEGYAVGFNAGAKEEGLGGDDDTAVPIAALLESLDAADNKNLRAAAIIANMKALMMAAIISGHLGRIEGSGDKTHLVFDEGIADFISTARGFNKFDPKLVEELFNPKDLRAIADGISRLATKLSTEYEEDISKKLDTEQSGNHQQGK